MIVYADILKNLARYFEKMVSSHFFFSSWCSYDIGLNASEAAAVRQWGGVELLPLPLSQLSDETTHPRGHVLSQPSSFAWKGARLNSYCVLRLTFVKRVQFKMPSHAMRTCSTWTLVRSCAGLWTKSSEDCVLRAIFMLLKRAGRATAHAAETATCSHMLALCRLWEFLQV